MTIIYETINTYSTCVPRVSSYAHLEAYKKALNIISAT